MKNFFAILLIFSVKLIQAQSFSPAGFASLAGYFSNANAQLEFNVGENVIGSFSNSNILTTNGTLQPEFNFNTIPTTQLRAIDCGKLNLTPDAQIAAIAVPGATLYHFEFQDADTGNFYGQKITSNIVISPSLVQPALQWNQQYVVRIKVFINGQWGNFGTSCTIGLMQDPAITGIPLTNIRNQYCNNTSNSLASTIVCNPVSMANRYEFKFTNSLNGNVHFFQSLTTSCPLSLVTPALLSGVNYIVQVRAKVYTTWGNFGTNCSITLTTPQAGNKEEISETENTEETDDFANNIPLIEKFTSYPNPFNEQTNLLFECETNENVSFKIYDMQGKLVYTITGVTNQPQQLLFDLNSGSYIVIATTNSGIQQQTKILKVN